MLRIPAARPCLAAAILALLAAAGTIPGVAEAFSVTGAVSFEGDSVAPYPRATVVLFEQGTTNIVDAVASSTVNGTYEFTDIPGGTYDLEVSAPCWSTESVFGLAIFQNGSIGTVQLAAATSGFSSIRLVGDFNGWNLSAPAMSFDGSCTWSDTLNLSSGTMLFKFVTDGAFDDDYGGVQSLTLDVPGGPYDAIPGVSGEGTAISIQVLAAGDYRFTLDEAAQTWSADYLGTLPQGSVIGTVAFEGVAEPPYQETTVQLLESGTTTVVRTTTSDASTRQFSFSAVADGTYDVRVIARCFLNGLESGVTVSGAPVDVGEIQLPAGDSPFSTIHLVGQFTDWDIDSSPAMTKDAACRWSTSLLLSPGTYYFKLITDGAFDNDYGGDESVTLTAPGTFDVKAGVFGGNAILMTFPAEDTYTFTLDEEELTLTVTGTTPVERATWGSIKTRYGH